MYVDAQSYVNTFMMSDDNISVELSKLEARTKRYMRCQMVQTVKL